MATKQSCVIIKKELICKSERPGILKFKIVRVGGARMLCANPLAFKRREKMKGLLVVNSFLKNAKFGQLYDFLLPPLRNRMCF